MYSDDSTLPRSLFAAFLQMIFFFAAGFLAITTCTSVY
ncbi:putative membrane protein [Vibrio parahaemolyticus VPTS-2009]|nr:putative membrane protein [Vibrio parahaemolyticus VPTS-2009]